MFGEWDLRCQAESARLESEDRLRAALRAGAARMTATWQCYAARHGLILNIYYALKLIIKYIADRLNPLQSYQNTAKMNKVMQNQRLLIFWNTLILPRRSNRFRTKLQNTISISHRLNLLFVLKVWQTIFLLGFPWWIQKKGFEHYHTYSEREHRLAWSAQEVLHWIWKWKLLWWERMASWRL